jgi:hypothetical protein
LGIGLQIAVLLKTGGTPVLAGAFGEDEMRGMCHGDVEEEKVSKELFG